MKNQANRSSLPSTDVQQSFIPAIRKIQAKASRASEEGIQAMDRIASEIVGQDCGQAIYLRSLLLSLYNGTPARLCLVGNLDWNLRKDFCAVLFGLNQGDFQDFMIREAFIRAGNRDAHWFLAGLHDFDQS